MARVSVLIPNYNHSAYLIQRIESVLNQTYQDFEVIILDDCSTDNSRAIIERYRTNDKVTQIIYNDTNSGSTFKQWEKGISLAKGEYIWIAESDDWCEATLLEQLVPAFEEDPDCAISYCQSYCVQGINNILFISQHSALNETVEGKAYVKKYLLLNNSIYNASMALWRKSLYQFIPKDFTQYKFCGDRLFWIQLAVRGNVHINGRLLNYFRKHDHDVSNKAYKNGLNFLEDLKVLNVIYTQQVINDREYKKAIKKLHRAYWPVRNSLDHTIKAEVLQLFKKPLSGAITYTTLQLGTFWSNIKNKKK